MPSWRKYKFLLKRCAGEYLRAPAGLVNLIPLLSSPSSQTTSIFKQMTKASPHKMLSTHKKLWRVLCSTM